MQFRREWVLLRPMTIVICGLCVSELSAQTNTSCLMTEDQDNCVRVVACIGDDGQWFNGRAFGRGEGVFAGTVSDGTLCEGTWMEQNVFGLGQADVSCADGRQGAVFYTYQDSVTGTAVGHGVLNTGEAVQIWSGNNVLQYLKSQTGAQVAMLPCQAGLIPMS